ncbi:MAG: AMP-binding protein, partial [Deltaproteobacteria bacterium]|nr:AMP-binding protein [Deltaproteobacteria bacterium]
MIEEVRDALGRARVFARALVKTGMAFEVSPRTLPVIARQRLRRESSLATAVRLHATSRPEREALVGEKRRLTWADLDRRVEALARGLYHHHGLRPGDPVLLVMRNCAELLEAQIAVPRIGASAVPVSWRSTTEELEYLVEHSGARAVIVETAIAGAVLSIRDRLDAVPRNCFIGVGERRDGLVPYERVITGSAAAAPDTANLGAVVIYTSGTTGRPKGAVRRFPRETQDAVLRFLVETPIREDDRHLAVCPMYHSTAFGFIGFTMAVGGTVVVTSTFDAEDFLRIVERERITSTAVVPTMLYRILDLPEEVLARYDTTSLRSIFCGGAPLSGALARRFTDRFGHFFF